MAVIDTERGSASLYDHLADFDVLNLEAPYSPERYIEAIHAAESAGYNVLIIDSITHEWSGVGGCLELVDDVARARYKGNSWSAWNDITPRHRALLDAILRSPMHVIVTLRSKTETAQTEENGRKKVVKLGMKAEQREGFEYEMTVVLDIVHEGHYATATKDRTGLFVNADPEQITEATGQRLLEWLETGANAPDVKAILKSLASAADIDVLRGHYEAAMQMLSEEHHAAIKKATKARKQELEQEQPALEEEGAPA